jgi:hypothetical protein
MRPRALLLLSACAGCLALMDATAGAATMVIDVGLEGQCQTISGAVAAADADSNQANYYVINVAPGTYFNDFPAVTRPMTIRSNPSMPGRAILRAIEPLPNEKGIILTTSKLTVRRLVFEGAFIDNSLGGNGAGIRDQQAEPGARLVVENSVFQNNQEGILQGDDFDEAITIVNSRFINNGNPDQSYFQHGAYINYAASLSVTNSLFCGQLIGHSVKSRAMVTTVSNSRIYDGAAGRSPCRVGSSSYAIDFPNGGVATAVGNLLVQGPASQNYAIVAYGEEGLLYPDNSIVIKDNTFSNTAPDAIRVYDETSPCIPVQTSGNTFKDVTTPVDSPQRQQSEP